MRLQLPLTSSGLRRRTLIVPGSPAMLAALFPMFDRDGSIRRVLVLDTASPTMWCFDPAENPVQIPLWGPIRVDAAPFAIRRLRAGQRDVPADLWHFDPWGFLKDDRYEDSEVAAALLPTNCVGMLPTTITKLFYRRDLSRVSGVLRSEKGGSQWSKFPRDALPAQPPRPPRPARAGRPVARPPTWRLAPFWLSAEGP